MAIFFFFDSKKDSKEIAKDATSIVQKCLLRWRGFHKNTKIYISKEHNINSSKTGKKNLRKK